MRAAAPVLVAWSAAWPIKQKVGVVRCAGAGARVTSSLSHVRRVGDVT